MRIELPDRSIEVFTITPRTTEVAEYWPNIERTIEWTAEFDGSGVLLFTGNDTFVEPWLLAQSTFERTSNLSPLVAVNPIYMHPFTTAKMISSFAYLYGRKTYLNMVTGTAVSYLHAMADELSHDERYDRLREYAEIVRALLDSTAPVTYEGEHYQVENLQLQPGTPPELQPEFLFAGQSDAAVRTAAAVEGIHMQMLSGRLASAMTPGAEGVHFGVVTRPTEDAAWEAAHRLFPEDRAGRRKLECSMSNTDSVWKKRLKIAADAGHEAEPEYWLEPFCRFQADCPYLVGSYDRIAERISELAATGVRAFILDIPAAREEFAHTRGAFRAAAVQLRTEVASR